MIDICICTHNPRTDVLNKTLASLCNQTASPSSFSVTIIDNASEPALQNEILEPLKAKGISARLLHEENLGLSQARLRAIEETKNQWVVFVDDDNELQADYLSVGVSFIQDNPSVGCFGGKLLLPVSVRVSEKIKFLLPRFGIKDAGDADIINASVNAWGDWEPAGAGAWVNRAVLTAYRQLSFTDSVSFQSLGRKGSKHVASCDDSLMMRCAYSLGMANAYHPKLVLYHHLDPKRFKISYLVRFMYAYGVSVVILENLLKHTQADTKAVPQHRPLLTKLRELETKTLVSKLSLCSFILFVIYNTGKIKTRMSLLFEIKGLAK